MKQTDRDQRGTVWEENGKVWVRYTEYTSQRKTRPVACLGTVEELNGKTKIERARTSFMAAINAQTTVIYWGALCDNYLKHDKRFNALTGDGKINRKSIVNKLRNAVYTGRRGEETSFAKERLDHLVKAQGRMKLEDWLNDLQVTANYRHDIKGVLRQVFHYAQKMDYIKVDTNPADLIDVRNIRSNTKPARGREIITAQQYEAVLNDPLLPEYAKVILRIMKATGCRGCEALGLSWGHGQKGDPDYRPRDIDFDAQKIWIRRSAKGRWINATKTPESERTVPMLPTLASILLRWKAAEPVIDGWLFGSKDKRSGGRPYHPTTVRHQFQLAAQRQGFGGDIGFGLHNNRHTVKAAMESSGATDQEQMRLLGHNNPRTLFKYNRKPDNAKELYPFAERVAELLGDSPSPNRASIVPVTKFK